MSENDCVLIAGAGPVGMTTALALVKAGIPVKVYDALAEIPTDASALARRFFLKQGWQDGPRQDVTRHGVTLHNYRMAKDLKPALERAA